MELPTPEDLRQRRTGLDLTQSALAEMAGVSQPLIARIEGGDVDPRLSTLRRIVEALDEAEGDVVRAGDIMNETVASVQPDESVRAAEARMNEQGYSQLVVIRQAGSPVGSISHTEVVDALNSRDDPGNLPVSEVMSPPFPAVGPDATVDNVRSYLEHSKAVLVTDGGEAVGIITEADLAAQVS
jgi:predicted transcriptional regulator